MTTHNPAPPDACACGKPKCRQELPVCFNKGLHASQYCHGSCPDRAWKCPKGDDLCETMGECDNHGLPAPHVVKPTPLIVKDGFADGGSYKPAPQDVCPDCKKPRCEESLMSENAPLCLNSWCQERGPDLCHNPHAPQDGGESDWGARFDELTEQTHYCSDLAPRACRNLDHLEVGRKELIAFIRQERAKAYEEGYGKGYADGQIAAKGFFLTDVLNAKEAGRHQGFSEGVAAGRKEKDEIRLEMTTIMNALENETNGTKHEAKVFIDPILAAFDRKRKEQESASLTPPAEGDDK